MRWIILTLLLANIALGGYHYWESSQPADDGPAPTQAELNNLSLGSDTLAELRRLERQAPTQQHSGGGRPRARPAGGGLPGAARGIGGGNIVGPGFGG